MRDRQYWVKVSEFSRLAKLHQAELDKFFDDHKDVSPEGFTDEVWEEHDKLVNALNTNALAWCEFCSRHKESIKAR